MSTQLPGEQQRRTGSSSHCGQKMSAGGKRGEEEEDTAGAPSGGPYLGTIAPIGAPAQPETTSPKPLLMIRHTGTRSRPAGRASEMCVDRTHTLPLAERTGGEGSAGALFLWPTSQIRNEAVQVTHKPQADLVVGEGKTGDGSPLSFSGKKPLEKDLVVPQFVARFFGKLGRASLAPYMQQITNQLADVTGSQQQSCQSVQKTQKREWDSVFQTRYAVTHQAGLHPSPSCLETNLVLGRHQLRTGF